jgi:hypothetical protein
MHETASAANLDIVAWEPLIIAIGAALVGLITWLVRTMTQLVTQVALLNQFNADNKKIRDEVIDLKVASAELDHTAKDHTGQIDRIWDTIEKHHPTE